MKNSIKIFVAIAVLAISCAPKKDKYEVFADDLCKCLSPMADFQKQLEEKFKSGQQDSVLAMLYRGKEIDSLGQVCMADLEKKHGKIEGEEAENKAMDALRKICPETLTILEEANAPMEPGESLEEEDMMMPEMDSTGEAGGEQ